MLRLFYILLMVLFVPEVLAGPFDPVPTDKSVTYLGIIFGSNVGSIYLGGAASTLLPALMEKFNFIIVVVGLVVLSYVSIMSTVNTAHEGTAMGKKWSAVWIPMRSVAGMALMVPGPATGYSMIQMTIMWIVLQGIGAADTIWSLALDQISAGGNNYRTAFTSSVQQEIDGIFRDKYLSEAGTVVPQLLSNAVCIATVKELKKLPQNATNQSSPTWVATNGNNLYMFDEQEELPYAIDATTSEVTISGNVFFGIKDQAVANKGVCGVINVKATVTSAEIGLYGPELQKIAQTAYDTKVLALTTAFNILEPLATDIAQGKLQDSAKESGYKIKATDAYASIIGLLVVPPELAANNVYSRDLSQKQKESRAKTAQEQADAMNSYGGYGALGVMFDTMVLGSKDEDTRYADRVDSFKVALDIGKKDGWVSAGAYYFVINNSPITSTPLDTATREAPAIHEGFGVICNKDSNECQVKAGASAKLTCLQSPSECDTLTNRAVQASTFFKNDKDISKGKTETYIKLTPVGGGNIKDDPLGPLNEALAGTFKSFVDAISSVSNSGGQLDPLYAHAQWGRTVMITCETVFFTMLALSAVFLAVAWGMGWLPGSYSGALVISYLVFVYVLKIVSFFLAPVWTFGATLAVYCPLIPFMIFTMGVLGWLLTVIEAVIAGPIIALGLVMPSGEELGRLDSALNILANIFLRPMLMVLGFLIASRLYGAICALVDYGIVRLIESVALQSLLSIIVLIGAYVTFITSITNSAFSLIYAVPDKILRWMGQHGEQTSMGEAMGETKGAVSSTAGKVGAAGSGALNAANDFKKEREGEKEKEEEKKLEKAKLAAQLGGGGGGGGGAPGGGGGAPGGPGGGGQQSGGQGGGQPGGQMPGGQQSGGPGGQMPGGSGGSSSTPTPGGGGGPPTPPGTPKVGP